MVPTSHCMDQLVLFPHLAAATYLPGGLLANQPTRTSKPCLTTATRNLRIATAKRCGYWMLRFTIASLSNGNWHPNYHCYLRIICTVFCFLLESEVKVKCKSRQEVPCLIFIIFRKDWKRLLTVTLESCFQSILTILS